MKVLLIDTCGETCSVALVETSGSVSESTSAVLPGRSASERLISTIRNLVSSSGASLTDLDTVAVVNGPGSFTGVRVGVSAAKGLCQSLGLPVIAISRLAVMAESAAADSVLSVLDAGRGEFYCGLYESGCCVREALLTRAELIELAAEFRIAVCETRVAEVVAELTPILLEAPTAMSALPIALRRIAAGQLDDILTLDANYLRRTDAEILAKQAARVGR